MENKTFIWASAHKPTQEQLDSLQKQGTLIFLGDIDEDLLSNMMDMQLDTDLNALAFKLLSSVHPTHILVQPAGSPAFQNAIGQHKGVIPVWYAFSKRVSEEVPQADGSVRKVTVFKHEGWVTT
jgi:hypothetical protein